MNISWQLLLYEDQKLVHTAVLVGAVELGRARGPEETLYSRRQVSGRQRVVIAVKDEKSVSRQHALIEPQPEGGFRLTNLSGERTVGLPDQTVLKANGNCTVHANALLTVGKKTIRLQEVRDEPLPLKGLAEATAPPGRSSPVAASFAGLPLAATAGVERMAFVSWLQAAMDVFQSAAGAADFFDKAAQAVVDLVRLDAGRVLLLKGEEWRPQALHYGPQLRRRNRRAAQPPCAGPGAPGEADLLAGARPIPAGRGEPAARSTPWWPPRSWTATGQSSAHSTATAARQRPIVRRADHGGARRMLVELLARGVAAGLARLEQEQAAARRPRAVRAVLHPGPGPRAD